MKRKLFLIEYFIFFIKYLTKIAAYKLSYEQNVDKTISDKYFLNKKLISIKLKLIPAVLVSTEFIACPLYYDNQYSYNV